MKKRSSHNQQPCSPERSGVATGTFAPSPSSLAWLSILGVLSALWALFLWAELRLARYGGTPFCALGGEADCVRVWDSAFASVVHRVTGLPVAAWGVVWGIAAFILPLGGLVRAAEGRPVPAVTSAVRLTAAVGAVAVFVMMVVSAAEGAFCAGCVVTELLVAGYAGIALFGWQRAGLPAARRGLAFASGATAAGFVLLLYPGLRTPRSAAEVGRAAITGSAPAAFSPRNSGGEPGTGTPDGDRRLSEFVASLAPQARQILADSLHIYRRSPAGPLPAPRALLGPPDAPVRITELTDVFCDHCAELHATLHIVGEQLPAGSFAVERRHFPLDQECNPLVHGGGNPVRCLAAKAQICLEGHKGALEFASALYESRKSLTPQKVLELAEPYVSRRALEACVAAPETRAKLEADIALGASHDPEGTPIVLVNGRKGTSFGPFLYAMVLTRGVDTHPAFSSLPAPNPAAHLH